MTTTATGRAASNGSTQDREPKELTGMARVREAEAWRTAAVVHDAAFEAERLCNDIYQTIREAYQPSGDSTAAQAAASENICSKADEARQLLVVALDYLNALTAGPPDPPF